MELTGKCKEDFIKFINNLEVGPYESMLDNIPKCYLNALIIEFLDSVGIHVNALKYNDIYFHAYCKKIMHEKYDSRQEALTEAIKKANEIYNTKKLKFC